MATVDEMRSCLHGRSLRIIIGLDEANLKEPEKLPRGDVWQDGGLWENVPFPFRVNKPDSGKTVTADALHCRRETCRRIMQRKGEYLFGLKENQPSLLENVRLLF